eukprot:1154147-Pelagomonas_calceolata.AAC.4
MPSTRAYTPTHIGQAAHSTYPGRDTPDGMPALAVSLVRHLWRKPSNSDSLIQTHLAQCQHARAASHAIHEGCPNIRISLQVQTPYLMHT